MKSHHITRITTISLLALTFIACNAPSGPRIGSLGESIYPTIIGGEHTKTQAEIVTYAQKPPIGGKHAGIWQNAGIYDQPIRNETVVHALEHGAVWITYRTDIAESDKGTLRQIALGKPYVLLSVYENKDAPIVLTAWGVQLKLKSLDDDKIDKFIAAYANGSESIAPEKGAAVQGGTGTPRQ